MTVRPSQLRVLIAGDDDVVADTLALILNLEGLDAEAVYSGEEALEMAPIVHPNVLVSDVIMGKMTGIEAAISIMKILPNCKVILCSGQHASEELLRRAAENGHSFEVLSRPVSPPASHQPDT